MRDSFFGLFLFTFFLSSGQEVKINSGFLEDSLGIGEEINFWISASFPHDKEILFPDSNFNFAPFEYVRKTYSPSKLSDRIVTDTVVYTLQSFEIDSVQYLGLPVYFFTDSDSTTLQTGIDSIYFRDLVTVASDTTSLKTNLGYREVNKIFNYPLLWIISGSLIVIAVLILLIFGKKIRKNFRIRKLRKDYIYFSNRLTEYIGQLKKQPSPELSEEVISFWKKYYEKLESAPISKLTTREILELSYTSELNGSLKAIDKCIYGKSVDDQLYRSFQSIEDFTQHRYTIKLSELKDEK